MPFICPDCNEDDRYCRCDSYDDDEVDDFGGGFAGDGVDLLWYDEPPARDGYARVLRRLAAKRRRTARHHAALARCGPRLRRAIRAARKRRDRCGDDCHGRLPGRFDHTECPNPF